MDGIGLVLRRSHGEALIFGLASPRRMEAASAHAEVWVLSRDDGDSQIYTVLLPAHFTVRPVDWRRFAFDEARVTELIARCLHDNLDRVRFEGWSDQNAEKLKAGLWLALRDLSSVFDVKEVRCEMPPHDGAIFGHASGELKNGQVISVVSRLSLDPV